MATFEDCIRCLEYTGCDGVMSSESILEYPPLFDPQESLYDIDQVALQYLDLVDKYPGEADLKNTRSHLHKFLYTGFKEHTDLRDQLTNSKTLEEYRAVVVAMIERRKGIAPEKKLGWYYRYWASEGRTLDVPTWRNDEWNEQIQNDPIFNKKMRNQAGKSKDDNVKNENILMEGDGLDMSLGNFLGEEGDAN